HFRQTVGLVMAEVKNLKNILAAYNSSVGDAVLREVADRIRACIRIFDGFGRYDGNKFLMILPGVTLAQGTDIAQKIYKHINSTPLVISQTKVFVTMGFGVAVSDEEGKLDRDTLLQAVDAAVGRIKGTGGAYIESATVEPNQSIKTA